MTEVPFELIDKDLLPHSLQKLSEVIGLRAALKLTALYPGVSLYIPAVPIPNHEIELAIGSKAFTTLVDCYQHDTLILPTLDSVHRQVKHHLLLELKRHGESNRSIALKINYTQRHVERLVSSYKSKYQIDLYGET